MKKFIIPALVLLMGVAACNKAEVPEAQPEEPAAEAEQQLDVKSVAIVIEEAIQKEEISVIYKDLLFQVREGVDNRHFEFEIDREDIDFPFCYLNGAVGLVKGDKHPVVIDMDILLLEKVRIIGTLDPIQVHSNLAKAFLTPKADECDALLEMANEGIDLKIADSYCIRYMRYIDEKGRRQIGLFLLDPAQPEMEPFPLHTLFKVIYAMN